MSQNQDDLSQWYKRAQDEILDDLDEELELELDDQRLGDDSSSLTSINRQFYFKELFRLQKELIKLQDWVVHQKLKVVVVFEGRDSAGKGPSGCRAILAQLGLVPQHGPRPGRNPPGHGQPAPVGYLADAPR